MRRVRSFLTGGLVAVLMLAAAAFPAPVTAATDLIQVKGLDHVKAVAASGDLYMALRADGSVWFWTDDGSDMAGARSRMLELECRVRAMAPGPDLTALLCADGSVWTARMAINTKGTSVKRVTGADSAKAVAMGRSGLVVLRTDGTVSVAEYVPLMDNGTLKAVQVPDLTGVTAVAAGIDDFVAVTADGGAWRSAMAINTKGMRLQGLPPVRGVAVCGGDNDCDDHDDYIFETADGKAVTLATGADGTSQLKSIGDLDCSGCVSVGHARMLSLTATGDARSTQFTGDGRVIVNDIKKGHAAFKQVAAGGLYDMGLAADGTVWMWRSPPHLSRVQGLDGIREIASAGDWNLALAADGRLFCWGSSTNQRTLVIPHVLEVSHIMAAPDYYLTFNADGTVAAGVWPAAGSPPAPPVPQPGVAAKSGSGYVGHVSILKFDGTVEEARVSVDVSGVTLSPRLPIGVPARAIQVAAGEDGYLILGADGTVWAVKWGQKPARVTDVAGVRAVSAGGKAYAVLMGDGSVRGIAIDEQGVHVWGDPHVDESDGLAAGGGGGGGGSGGVIALRADGTVVTFSQTVGAGQVTEILDGIAVSAGARGNLVLMGDGSVWKWR